MDHPRPPAKEALDTIAPFLCAMTGGSLAEFMAHARHAVIDAPRTIALHVLRERVGYNFTEIGRAFPIDEAANAKRVRKGKRPYKVGRHRTAVTHATKRGWELLDGAGEAGLALRDWIEVHWRDPIEQHRDRLDAMRRVFNIVIEAARQRDGERRVQTSDIIAAVEAMGCIVQSWTGELPPAPEPIEQDEPVSYRSNEPDPVQFLRMAPVLRGLELVWDYMSGGRLKVGAALGPPDKASKMCGRIVRMLGEAGFRAVQTRPGRGHFWMEIAPLAAASILFALSPIFAPVDTRREYSHV